jgi:signal transduction histidine kinase
VYSASHDLSAPLKSILGLLNIAKLDKDTGRTSEYLTYIQDSILKLEEVIKSLISYSRNSRLALEMEPVNLYDLIHEIFDELQFLDGARRITHSVNIKPGLSVMSDRKRLKIIFHNLLNNAIKYADLDKPSPMIIVSLIDDGDHWIIEVHDNGIGIDKAFIDKVFGMFYRATEKSKGSGLGLFIVQETISVLGGKVFLDSTLGKESTFSIFLPKQLV